MMTGGPNRGTKFRVLSFHFHWGHSGAPGSEHSLNKHQAKLEMHVVHYVDGQNPDHSAKSVVGVLIEVGGNDNPAFSGIVSKLSGGALSGSQVAILSRLLPNDWKRNYYAYAGSLTTPPCTENVQWIVAKTKVYISPKQMEAFYQLGRGGHALKDNFRNPKIDPNRKVFENRC